MVFDPMVEQGGSFWDWSSIAPVSDDEDHYENICYARQRYDDHPHLPRPALHTQALALLLYRAQR